jgi:hypothetical protein
MAIRCEAAGPIACPPGTVLAPDEPCTLDPDLINSPACDTTACCRAANQGPQTEQRRPPVRPSTNPQPGGGNPSNPVPVLPPQPITCDSSGVTCPDGQTLVFSNACTLDPDLVSAPECNVATCCASLQPPRSTVNPAAQAITCEVSGVTCPAGQSLVRTLACTLDPDLINAPECNAATCCTAPIQPPQPESFSFMDPGQDGEDANGGPPKPIPVLGPQPISCDSSGVKCPDGQPMINSQTCTLVPDLVQAPECNVATCCTQAEDGSSASPPPPGSPEAPGSPAPIPIPKPQPIMCEAAGITCPDGHALVFTNPCTFDPDLIGAPECNAATCCTPMGLTQDMLGPGPIPIPKPQPVTCDSSGVVCPEGKALAFSNICTLEVSLIDAPECNVDNCCQ